MLTLPQFDYKLIHKRGKKYIFDILRKKYVVLSPEEWVRQHVIHFLVNHLHYPAGLMKVEATLPRQRFFQKRPDIVIYDGDQHPIMIVECKAPQTQLSQSVRSQMLTYNAMHWPFLLFTNGIKHFCFFLDALQRRYNLLEKIPTFFQAKTMYNHAKTRI